MTRFRVIPVIDLRGGLVVRARAGQREAYAPIETPLARGSAPADVARGLLVAYPSDRLYIADLDAIVLGRAPDSVSLKAIRTTCPEAELWVDAGFARRRDVDHFLGSGLGRPILGSESQHDAELVRDLGDRAVLSLDTRGGERLGPADLHERGETWPGDVIAMSLARIGVNQGPDLDAIRTVRDQRPDVRIYAAGGVRGREDIEALEAVGAAGALVASAIHDGALRRSR